MARGSVVWNDLYSLALVTVHEAAENELEKEGKSFEELPDVFGNNYRKTMAHTTALVGHHTLPTQGAEIWNVSKVREISIHSGLKPYSDVAMSLNNLGSVYQNLGKLNEALEVREQSLEMYRTIHGGMKPHPDIATSLRKRRRCVSSPRQAQECITEARTESGNGICNPRT